MRGALLLAIATVACKEAAPAPDAAAPAVRTSSAALVFRSYRAMGTQIAVTVRTADEERALAAMKDAFLELDRLEGLMTVWRPDSDVARLNAAAGVSKVAVSPETLEVLARSRRFHDLSGGKFDVSFGALSGLWKFDHDKDGRIPSRDAVAARLPLIDQKKLVLDPEGGTAFLPVKGMSVHLGGIGKGYGVDRVVAILRGAGFADFMVQAGGDLYVAGTRGDRAWRVGIRDPRGDEHSYFAAAEITDATFSTSGDYERSFVEGGVRYHHILDPHTGQPARLCRSVTAMAKDALTADALSTSVFLVGPEKGLAMAEGIEGAGVVIVDAENQVHVSRRLEGRVKILHPPTDGI